MIVTELDSFVQKFYQLWNAAVTAHLDVDTHAGRAWVGLRVQLGQVPAGPVHHPVHRSPHRQRGPAYQRRQEMRKAAQALSTADLSFSDSDHEIAEEAAELAVTTEEASKVTVEETSIAAEEANKSMNDDSNTTDEKASSIKKVDVK